MPFESIRSLLRNAVNSCFLKPLRPPFALVADHAWRAEIPGTRAGDPNFLLYEDGDLLGPDESSPSVIESLGRGHYGRDDGQLVFSTSDNSNPNNNGRQYSYSVAPFLAKRRKSEPNNYRLQDVSPEAIEREVDRLISGASRVLEAIAPYMPNVQSAEVLEIGPGKNYGWLILVACAGAIPSAVDAYPAQWDARYHLTLFQALRERLDECPFITTTQPLDTIIHEGGFETIPRSGASLEQTTYLDDAYDLVFSNAVLEHLYDPIRGAEQLFRVTKPGGIGCHWVDFRDHRDFDRPLEYLLLTDEQFAREFGIRHAECGNRCRQDETEQQLLQAGFEILDFETTFQVEPDYLTDFLPRLRAAAHSSYQNIDTERLKILHGRFLVRKPSTGSG